MPGSSRKIPAWLPILVILIAMVSIQSGASLAKSLFPLVGAPGVTALRLALGTLILVIVFKPWRLRFTAEQRLPLLLYGLALGAMNYLFYLSIQRIPLGIAVALEFTGPLAVALFGSRRPLDFVWVILAVLGLWFLLPLGQDVAQVDLTGALLALGAGACWAVYILTGQRAGEEHGPGNGGDGIAYCRRGLCPAGHAAGKRHAVPVVAAAAGTGHRRPLYGAAVLAGNDCPHPYAYPHIRHADEHGAGARRAIGHDISGRDADLYANPGARGDYPRLNGLYADDASGK